jgi:hypothetical protein
MNIERALLNRQSTKDSIKGLPPRFYRVRLVRKHHGEAKPTDKCHKVYDYVNLMDLVGFLGYVDERSFQLTVHYHGKVPRHHEAVMYVFWCDSLLESIPIHYTEGSLDAFTTVKNRSLYDEVVYVRTIEKGGDSDT